LIPGKQFVGDLSFDLFNKQGMKVYFIKGLREDGTEIGSITCFNILINNVTNSLYCMSAVLLSKAKLIVTAT